MTIGGQPLDVTRSPCALLATFFPLDELRFRVSRVAP
jgi:hypothetical protein